MMESELQKGNVSYNLSTNVNTSLIYVIMYMSNQGTHKCAFLGKTKSRPFRYEWKRVFSMHIRHSKRLQIKL